MKLLKESMSVEDQERLILYASNNAKVKDKVLDILKTEYELREDDLYDCEYVIDNASWEKEHKHEFSYWNLDTIIRDHLIDTIIEVKHNLSKHKSLSEYKNFVAKSFDPHLVIDMIREFLQEHPFENEAHNTFEDFEEYIANELFDKEVKELTSEESYAISDVWESLNESFNHTIKESTNSSDKLKDDLKESFKVVDKNGKKVPQGGGFTSRKEAEMFAAQYGEKDLRVVKESLDGIEDIGESKFGTKEYKYKKYTIEYFPIDAYMDGMEPQHIESYIIKSPAVLTNSGYHLPLYCEDEKGNEVNFRSLQQVKDWIDKFDGKFKLQWKHGDELHAVIKDEFLDESLYQTDSVSGNKMTFEVNDSERYLIRKNSGAGEVVYETNDLQDAIEELRALGKSYYIDDTQKDITIKYSQAIKMTNAVHKVATTESAKKIVANIYDKSGNILETRHFSSKKQLDSFVDNLNNLIDMTADNNVLYKDSKGNVGIWDIWKITVDDLITEEAKKKKELGAFVKLDAGDVEEGNKFFNKAVAGTESESGCSMSEDLRTINIRDELNKLDTIDYNDLVNMYDCLKLSDFEKTKLAQLLFNHDNENVIKFISDRYYKENICEQVEDEYSDAPNTLLSKRDRLSKRLSEINQERAKIEKTIDYQQDHNYSVIDFDLIDKLDELNMEAEIINKKLEEI